MWTALPHIPFQYVTVAERSIYVVETLRTAKYSILSLKSTNQFLLSFMFLMVQLRLYTRKRCLFICVYVSMLSMHVIEEIDLLGYSDIHIYR